MSRSGEPSLHLTNLDYTLRELSRQVEEHESELQRLRAAQKQDASLSPVAQVAILTTALEAETNSEPFLPFPGSILPALLALRKTHQTIKESREFLASESSELDEEKRQLEGEEANLRDQKLLTEALGARIESLQNELDSSADLQPEDTARERLDELRKRKRNYDRETSKLLRSLNGFIDKQLAPMLAAEELGGPVVGDLMDVDSEDLAAGFNAQGKLKKAKQSDASQDKRQRRIDEIWGGGEGQGAGTAPAGGGGDGPDDEAAAAGAEMKKLTEELLNTMMEARGDSSASYLQLPRESAVSRFLVRSKVAQFHPRDATRIRLIDFGRDLD